MQVKIGLGDLIHAVRVSYEDVPSGKTDCGAVFTWDTAPEWYKSPNTPIGRRSLADPTCISCIGTKK